MKHGMKDGVKGGAGARGPVWAGTVWAGSVWAVALAAILCAALFLSIRLGAAELSTREIMEALRGAGSETGRFIVLDLRLPRALMGLLVGGGLAVSGATFQALLRNPLAEPYILGISGGAASGALLVLALGWMAETSWLLPLAAFSGAALAIFLVFGVALSADWRMDVRVLLLSGVVVGAFFTAGIALILALADAPTMRSALLWMMGSLSGSSWSSVSVVAGYTLPLAAALFALSRSLNLMSIGEETAAYLGTDVETVKRLAYGAASFIAAAGVAFAGVIGFVGLIVPHALRLMVGSDNRLLLPLSFLAGAGFLTVADLVARTALAPSEIPIGVVTAFLGVPMFLLLLRRSIRP
ncbi:MAG: iron ABC transporter permease [Gemmatimonadetes bacterium]|nr:iron ABC transporter permease [Gemmatimonadota bacterium]